MARVFCIIALVTTTSISCSSSPRQKDYGSRRLSNPGSVLGSDEALAIRDSIGAMPPWYGLDQSDAISRKKIENACSLVADHNIDIVREAMVDYVRGYGQEQCIGDLGAGSRLFVLNRYLFAVPKETARDEVYFFGAWRGVPVNGGNVNLLWPWSDSSGSLKLSGRCHGYNGPVYRPIEEFDYFKRTFGLRVTGRAKTGQRGALKTGQCFDVASYTSFDAVPTNFP